MYQRSDQTVQYPIFQLPYNGTAEPMGVGMAINGRIFNPHYFDGDVVGGTCEEWTVKSSPNTAPIHSFHAHFVPFYVTSRNGVVLDEADRFWRDTMASGFNFTATVCFPSRDDESYINVHCHMPIHQDIGMAMFYKYLPGGETEEAPPATAPGDSGSGAGAKSGLAGIAVLCLVAVLFY